MKHFQTYKKTPFDLDTKLERVLYKRKYKNSTGAVNGSFDTYRHDNSKLKNFDYRPDQYTSKEKGWAYKAKTDVKEHPLNETYHYNSKGALEIQYERALYDVPRSQRPEYQLTERENLQIQRKLQYDLKREREME